MINVAYRVAAEVAHWSGLVLLRAFRADQRWGRASDGWWQREPMALWCQSTMAQPFPMSIAPHSVSSPCVATGSPSTSISQRTLMIVLGP